MILTREQIEELARFLAYDLLIDATTRGDDLIATARAYHDLRDAVLALHAPVSVPTSGSSLPDHETTWTFVCRHCGSLAYPCATAQVVARVERGAS